MYFLQFVLFFLNMIEFTLKTFSHELQPTSVLGHKRSRKDFKLPVNDEDQALLKVKDKLSDNFDRRVELLSEQFDEVSSFL